VSIVGERLLTAGVPKEAWDVIVLPPLTTLPLATASLDCDPEVAILECDGEPTPPGWWSLQETVRGARGGLQIRNVSTAANCSLGFNVVEDPPGAGGDPRRFFVTASHCTNFSGSMGGAGAWQAVPGAFLGTEIFDPPFTTGSPLCPPGAVCRFSDAALFEYSSATDAGGAVVAWPTSLGGTTFSTSRNVSQTEVFGFVGTPVQKVGRSSGRTAGTVTQSCVNFAPNASNVPVGAVLLCQGVMSAFAVGGDSGGPVVRVLPSGALSAVGILWGAHHHAIPDRMQRRFRRCHHANGTEVDERACRSARARGVELTPRNRTTDSG